ncbi:MAG: hypothetical protein OEU84_10970 [Xanthomonadales bacterium]|nr:hypothetical protein [Xanthomonadales bacterium]
MGCSYSEAGLIEAGVDESQIALTTHGEEVIFEILDACKPGDLFLILLGHREKHLMPGYIKNYAARLEKQQENQT